MPTTGQFRLGYSKYLQPEPKIAALILESLGSAQTIVNVGAGAGCYEPVDREIHPIEPSASMRAQRPPHLAQAVEASAERLPFPDRSVEAALATFTVHQWQDLSAGLREMRRVSKGPVVILTCDPLFGRELLAKRLRPWGFVNRGTTISESQEDCRGVGWRYRGDPGSYPAPLPGRIQRILLRSPRTTPGLGSQARLLGLEFRRPVDR